MLDFRICPLYSRLYLLSKVKHGFCSRQILILLPKKSGPGCLNRVFLVEFGYVTIPRNPLDFGKVTEINFSLPKSTRKKLVKILLLFLHYLMKNSENYRLSVKKSIENILF
jgi:hypothetical protein